VNLLAAVGALKGVNLTEDFGSDMNTLKMLDSIICSWIEKNPDKAKSIAFEIANTVKEYEDIQTNWWKRLYVLYWLLIKCVLIMDLI